MTATAVGRNVAAELARRHRSHEWLSDALAGTGQALTTWQVGRRIRGEVEFTALELVAVAQALGVPLADLLPATPAKAEDAP